MTLTFNPTEPKINRDHVLIETNPHVKYEGSAINGSQDIERKRSVTADGRTDGWTDGQGKNNMFPSSWGGDIIILNEKATF